MSKVHGIRDFIARKNFLVSEIFYVALKYLRLKENPLCKKKALFFLTKSISSKASKVRVVNRCVASCRGRGVIRSHGLSRIVFRDMLNARFIPGYRKGVW